ncbi:hypothetical protein G9A89_009662 [Geosiphon pyriformis]|nr:hypothetical protein G9A89_009662 [Geosiphon pyriformis]
MSNKKAPKDVFYGPTGGSFSQRKKASLGNVKHSDNKKDISLKSGSGACVYFDVKSLSGDDKDVSMSGGFDGSLLDLAVKLLLPLLKKKIPLNKIWIDPKIIKTPVEVSVKKSFALDINLLAVNGKLARQKTQFIRKIFSKINDFGGATTLLKFKGIIRSTFISKDSMKKAVLLAGENEININSDFKKQEIRSDQAVVIKKILMDMPKDMIVAAVSKFGQIKLIKIQLIEIWQKAVIEFNESRQANLKNSVYVAKTVRDCDTWALRNQFRALLFTLPVEMTAHDLSTLLNGAGGKTCIINQFLDTGNRVHCTVVSFKSEEDLDTAFHTEPIFGGVRLSWARLDLVKCEKYGCFGHLTLECDVLVVLSFELLSLFKKSVSGFNCFCLAKLYAKKRVPISRPAAFVVFFDSSSGGFSFGSSLLSGGLPFSLGSFGFQDDGLDDHLAVLKHSLEILSDQVSVILKKLSFVELVPLASPLCASPLAVSVPLALVVDLNMALDSMLASPALLFLSGGKFANGLSSSGSKVLTSKVGSLESKMSALEALFGLIIMRLDLLCSGSTNIVCWHVSSGNMIKDKFNEIWIFTSELDIGYLGAGVTVIMNISLACHVFRVKKVPDYLILIQLLFKGKLSVTILGLYAGISSGTRFAQASTVNFFIAKAVNSSTFVVLDGNFNKNNSGRSVNFKFCLGLSLVNLFAEHSLVKAVTWNNSREVEKIIDFILVSGILSFVVVKHCVNSVSDFFDTDHKSVMVLVGLNGLLDVWLNGLHKQTNRDHWKFRIKDADGFLGLELLAAKIIKCLTSANASGFNCFIRKWSALDAGKALILEDIYALLNYVRDDAFSGVISVISMGELLLITNGLPDDKAADLSGIPNEFWKHGCGEMLECLLVLLNICLFVGIVPALWKRVWVLMILKPHD